MFIAWPSILVGAIAAMAGMPPVVDDAPTPADIAFLKEAGLATDGQALVEYFRSSTLDNERRAELQQLVRQLGDQSFRLRAKTTNQLMRMGRAALPELQKASRSTDLEIAERVQRCIRAIETKWGWEVPTTAARLLVHQPAPGALDALFNFVPMIGEQALEIEFFAFLLKLGLREGKPDPLLIAGLTDDRPAIRRVAGWIVGRSRAAEDRARVVPLLQDSDHWVRLCAAQGLLFGKDKAGLPALVLALKEAPFDVARDAEDLLYRAGGESSPSVALSNDEPSRKACHLAWEQWLREKAPARPLSGFDSGMPFLGFTMILSMNRGDGKSGGSRVWEIDRSGKVRWEVKDLKTPVEAWVLPGNRVLIAEQGASRITERDFSGAIRWESVNHANLVGCQRLPNGNTVVVAYNKVYELDRQGKEVRTLFKPPADETMYSGQKLPNGNVLYIGSREKLTEVSPDGKVVRELPVSISGIGLVRAEVVNGGWMIGTTSDLILLNMKGEITWRSAAAARASSAQRLPGGNVLVSSDTNNKMMEVDRNGKLVWEKTVLGNPVRVRRR